MSTAHLAVPCDRVQAGPVQTLADATGCRQELVFLQAEREVCRVVVLWPTPQPQCALVLQVPRKAQHD